MTLLGRGFHKINMYETIEIWINELKIYVIEDYETGATRNLTCSLKKYL